MAHSDRDPRKHRHLVWIAVAAGALLTLIGIRFLIVPRTAANNFGLAKDALGLSLHHMVGLRDVWLGGLAIVLAILREWRALMWWFALAVPVCLADAAIAGASSGKLFAVAFHVTSGAICAAVALAIRSRLR